MKFRNIALVSLLSVALILTTGCSAAQFEQYLNAIGPAVSIVMQIIAVAGGPAVNTGLVTKINGDVANLEKLYSDYESVSAGSKSSVRTDLNNAFTVLNQDLGAVFQMAQVSNPNVQKKVALEIGLIESAVSLAESLIPSTSAAQAAKAELKAGELVDSFNKVNHAKTGLKAVDEGPGKKSIHRHGKFARYASFGLLK